MTEKTQFNSSLFHAQIHECLWNSYMNDVRPHSMNMKLNNVGIQHVPKF